MIAAVTVLLALVTGMLGLRAALLWKLASQSSGDTSVINGVPAISPLAARGLAELFHHSAQQNEKAARWTAWAALLGALTTLWSVLAPMAEKVI